MDKPVRNSFKNLTRLKGIPSVQGNALSPRKKYNYGLWKHTCNIHNQPWMDVQKLFLKIPTNQQQRTMK